MPFTLDEAQCHDLAISAQREWILTNGLGGYAMGTPSGVNTRRYHGLLVAAIRPPDNRMVLLDSVDAFVEKDGPPVGLSSHQYPGAVFPDGYLNLQSFSTDLNSATWIYRNGDICIEQMLVMTKGENTVTLRYKNDGTVPVQLTLRPLVCHKPYHTNFRESQSYPDNTTFNKNVTEITDRGVSLFLKHEGANRLPVQGWYYRFEHARESERGLDSRDDLYCPVELRYELLPGETAELVASDHDGAQAAPAVAAGASVELKEQLMATADLFFVQCSQRNSLIAGYPWFTDWGRDTMISIPGLCVATGRLAEGRKIVRDYAAARYQGLIPNRFAEDEAPSFNTVDATLWMANAMYALLQAEWDIAFANECLEILHDVVDWHFKGTLYGIKVDPQDGLLTQGQDGLQLTWMDAKVGDWVVTPRHGKPVEVNGLWVNLLRVTDWISRKLKKEGNVFANAAAKAEASFDSKFWHEQRGHYLDTVDPGDASLRPNQVIAMSLPFSPCKPEHATRALGLVASELLTPCGLRSLGPHEPGYRGRYDGPLTEMDASYHQGTVWPWLLGPFVSALLKFQPDSPLCGQALGHCQQMLTDYGLGGIAEVYDGDEPQRPNGCPWQAWNVAELLRVTKEISANSGSGVTIASPKAKSK
ncbi:MAG: glycogen debranching enzyme family protein [Armatimonadetes bacterium]|nr:glycogen debranching enzyme family protein [Armatimonadota bacterium]